MFFFHIKCHAVESRHPFIWEIVTQIFHKNGDICSHIRVNRVRADVTHQAKSKQFSMNTSIQFKKDEKWNQKTLVQT